MDVNSPPQSDLRVFNFTPFSVSARVLNLLKALEALDFCGNIATQVNRV